MWLLLSWVFVGLAVTYLLLPALRLPKRTSASIPTVGRPLPLVGNLHEMGNVNLWIVNQAEQFKDTCSPFRCYFMNCEVIVFQTLEAAREIFITSNLPKNPLHYRTLRNNSKGLITQRPPIWNRQRRLVSQAFSRAGLKAIYDTMRDVTEETIALWNKRAESATDRAGFEFTPLNDFSCHTFDVVCSTLFSFSPKASRAYHEGGEQHDLMKAATVVLFNRSSCVKQMLISELPWNLQREKAAVQVIHRKIDELFAQRQRGETGSSARGRPDILQLLMEAKDPDTGGMLSPDHLRDEITTLMFAGYETTAVTLTWLAYELARHPAEQSKLRSEIHGVLGDTPDYAVQFEDLERMPYLAACVKETLRLYPPVVFLPRTPEDGPVVVDGVVLPPGTDAFVSMYSIQRNPRYWGPDADQWRPERFLAHSDEENKDMQAAWMPFSAGPRNCVGRSFALLEIRTTMALLLRHFKLETVQGHEHVAMDYNLTLKPAGDFKLRAQKL